MRMKFHRQRGAISLGWSMVLFGLIVAAVFAALLSFGLERNLFAEGWQIVEKKLHGVPTLQKSKEASGKVKPANQAQIRKCRVNGQVMYSNVECSKGDAVVEK